MFFYKTDVQSILCKFSTGGQHRFGVYTACGRHSGLLQGDKGLGGDGEFLFFKNHFKICTNYVYFAQQLVDLWGGTLQLLPFPTAYPAEKRLATAGMRQHALVAYTSIARVLYFYFVLAFFPNFFILFRP